MGWEVFYQQHNLFEIHQVSYWARIFSLASRFSSLVLIISWKIFNRVATIQGFSPNRQSLRSAELAAKKRSNSNIMVMGPSNHIISIYDYVHNLTTWSLACSQQLHLDIVSLMLISVSLYFHVMIISRSLIYHIHTIFISWSPHHSSTWVQQV